MDFDAELFGNKKFSDLLKDIYENQKKKERQINLLIADLKPHITNIHDATAIVPVIKDFMEISIKNDDNLVKLAAIAQKMMNNKTDEGSSYLTEEEKQELLKSIQEVGKEDSEKEPNENFNKHTKDGTFGD
jgi:hypothetical protein